MPANNLPTTWTKEKMLFLLLFSGFNFSLVSGGQAPINCYKNNFPNYYSDNYNSLLNYPFSDNQFIKDGRSLTLCCNSNNCFAWNNTCEFTTSCFKTGQLIYCMDAYRKGGLSCDGILGNNVITVNSTSTSGLCKSDLNTTAEYIKSIIPLGLDQGYAHWICPLSNSPCSDMACSWDNGGWTCSYWPLQICFTNDNSFNCARNCTHQWTAPWPGTAEKNPLLGYVLDPNNPNKVISKTPTSTIISPVKNETDIPLIVGSTIGGTVTAGIGARFAYYFWKKKKNKKEQAEQLNSEQLELIQLNSNEQGNDKEVIELVIKSPVISSENAYLSSIENSKTLSFPSSNQYLESEGERSALTSPLASPVLIRSSSSSKLIRNTVSANELTHTQLIQVIKLRLDEEEKETLDHFLSAQELLVNASERNKLLLQRTYDQTKTELANVISGKEIAELERTYQTEIQQRRDDNQYLSLVEQRY